MDGMDGCHHYQPSNWMNVMSTMCVSTYSSPWILFPLAEYLEGMEYHGVLCIYISMHAYHKYYAPYSLLEYNGIHTLCTTYYYILSSPLPCMYMMEEEDVLLIYLHDGVSHPGEPNEHDVRFLYLSI